MSKAHLSLTLGVLAIITPYIGLIMGIIGSFYASKLLDSSEVIDGKKLILAGRVCSVIGISLQIILLILLGFSLIIYFLISM